MKQQFLICLLTAISLCAKPQDPVSPCCMIMHLDPPNGTALIRNNTTGQTMQLKTTAADINGLKLGDAVNADLSAKQISSINNVSKTYAITHPDPFEPCCVITSIKADPFVPCCNEVTIKNNSTGQTYNFRINESYLGSNKMNRSVVHELHIGGPVAFDPVDSYTGKIISTHFEPVDGYTDLKGFALLSVAMNGENTVYSYPVAASASSSQNWVMEPNTSLKGTTGSIVIKMPVSSHVVINIYKAAETQQTDAWHESNFMKNTLTGRENLLPGFYDIAFWSKRIDSIPVKIGNDTRILCGVLDINLKGTWKILDESKKEVYHLGLPQKVLLPVGNYFIATGKIEQPVTVADGRVTSF